MTLKELNLQVSESIGQVSAVLLKPVRPMAVLALAHGAGASMHHYFMQQLAEELCRKRVATLRYHFPYMERKKKRPDPPAVAMRTVKVAIELAVQELPDVPLFAGGKSFGGRMTSQLLAANCPASVRGVVLFGFPLHPSGKPGIERATHLQQVNVPMLFLQGTADALAGINLMENICSALPSAELFRIEGADHSFRWGKENHVQLLASHTAHWMNRIVNPVG